MAENKLAFVPIWQQKKAIKDVNKWIANWLRKSPNIQGAFRAYKYKGEDTLVIDVETSDGGVSALNYWELYAQASKHNFEYVTEDEYCECFY